MKLVVGIIMQSVSVISEAVHSGIDLVASVIAYFSVQEAGKPADDDHRLIVYDMKQKGLSYSEISELMYQAYACNEKQNDVQDKLTDNAFDLRTIENYHKNALALIAGGFKKYMQISK